MEKTYRKMLYHFVVPTLQEERSTVKCYSLESAPKKKNDLEGNVQSSSQIVEKIVGFYIGKDMRKYYQVQLAPVWERAENLIGCEKLIERFFNQNGLTALRESCLLDETVGDVDKRIEDSAAQEIDIFDVSNNDELGNSHTTNTIHQQNTKLFIVDNPIINTSHTNTDDACLDSDFNDDKDHSYFKNTSTEIVNNSFDGDSSDLNSTMFMNIPFHKKTGNTDLSRNCIRINTPHSNHQMVPRTDVKKQEGITTGEPVFKGIESNEIIEQQPHLKRPLCIYTSESNCDVRNSMKLHGKECLGTHKGVSTSVHSYNCNQCNISFQTMVDLKIHERTHIEKQPLICTQCNSEFISIYELRFHAKKHSNERPFKCNECDKTFPRNFDLKHHKYYHSREYIYECNVCNRKFKYSQQLKIHTRIHTGERPYKCNLCEKTFYCNGNLHSHKQTHTMERPFKCKQCNKSFKLKGNLRRHEKQHEISNQYK